MQAQCDCGHRQWVPTEEGSGPDAADLVCDECGEEIERDALRDEPMDDGSDAAWEALCEEPV